MPTAIPLSDAIDQYLTWRATVRRASTATMKAYRTTLGQFLAETGNIYLRSIQPHHIQRFQDVRSVDVGPHTMNAGRSRLTEFLAWGVRKRYISDLCLMEGWLCEKAHRREGKVWIHVEDVPALLDAAATPRDRIVLAVGLYACTRVSETTSIRVGQVDLVNLRLTRWQRKVHKEITRPIIPPFADELRKWMTHYDDSLMSSGQGPLLPDMRLVPTNDRGRDKVTGRLTTSEGYKPYASPTGLHRNVQEALQTLGYGTSQEGTHTLRRSGARILYDYLVEDGHANAIRMVQAMLGHATQSQTEEYIGIGIDEANLVELLTTNDPFALTNAAVPLSIVREAHDAD